MTSFIKEIMEDVWYRFANGNIKYDERKRKEQT